MDVGEGPPSQTIRNVESTGTRVSLRDIQQAPEYAELIDECLDEVEQLVAERQGGMTQRAGYLFISCPGFNYADALRSRAQLPPAGEGCEACELWPPSTTTGPPSNASSIATWTGANATFEAMQAVAETFTIEPGVGVYLPSFVPHWVETEAGISISFSIPFDTEVRGAGWKPSSRINKRMRRLHLSPRPIGASERVDRAKAAVVRSLTKLPRKLRA